MTLSISEYFGTAERLPEDAGSGSQSRSVVKVGGDPNLTILFKLIDAAHMRSSYV